MKQCPVCKSVYTDDTLSFCLNDGAALAAPSSSAQETQLMSFGSNETRKNDPPIRVEFLSETPTRLSASKNTTQPERKNFSAPAILSIVALLIFIGIAAVIAAYFAFAKRENQTSSVSQINSATAQNNNLNETQELKKELERLKKQIEEQKTAKTNSVIPVVPSPATASTPTQTIVTARVNSPNDGFLALRTAPSVKSGEQILQIPHGATVSVFDCQNYSVIGNKRGRWCRVKYDNQQGWAFDAFLVY